jgi:hypothetical protein
LLGCLNEYYSMLIDRTCKMGDLRKTMGIWMDINPVDISICSKERKLSDVQIIWDLIEVQCLDFQVKCER